MLPYLSELVPGQAALAAWASAALLRLVWLGSELVVAGLCYLPVWRTNARGRPEKGTVGEDARQRPE
jgi:hypothetical protein